MASRGGFDVSPERAIALPRGRCGTVSGGGRGDLGPAVVNGRTVRTFGATDLTSIHRRCGDTGAQGVGPERLLAWLGVTFL
jgi:hypothetical protein